MGTSDPIPAVPSIARIVAVRGAALGVALGLGAAADTIRLTAELAGSPWRSFLFGGVVVLFFAGSAIVLLALLAAVVRLAARAGLDGRHLVGPSLLWTTAALVALYVVFYGIDRVVDLPRFAKGAGYLALGVLGAAWLAAAWRRSLRSESLRMAEWALALLTAPALVAGALYVGGAPSGAAALTADATGMVPRFAPEPASRFETRGAARASRVLVVGIDGASWDRIDRGIREGRLPTFARLVANGRRASLATLSPTISPAIWTTMMTGVSPSVHGVDEFYVLELPRLGIDDLHVRPSLTFLREALAAAGEIRAVPVTSTLRRSKAIWNVADDAGRKTAVLGLWATWPPEPLRHGVVVSDHASMPRSLEWTARSWKNRAFLGSTTHPGSLAAELARFQRAPDAVTREELGQFLAVDDRLWEEFERTTTVSKRRPLSAFRSTHLNDQYFLDAARYLWDREHPSFLMVYARMIDELAHFFYDAGMPDAGELGVDPEDVRRYGGVIDRAYEWIDRRLSPLVEAADADPETLLVAVSDHGWAKQPGGYGHNHAPPGIVILYGSGVCRERCPELRRPTVYDVAPTVLWRMGLPLSSEMGGRPLLEAFADSPVVARVERYGERSSAGGAVPSAVDAALYEKLKALGYVQ